MCKVLHIGNRIQLCFASRQKDENANQWAVISYDRTTVMTRESKNFHPAAKPNIPLELLHDYISNDDHGCWKYQKIIQKTFVRTIARGKN